MAPSNGSTAPVPHKAVAGLANERPPDKFYPFCAAGDFSGGGRTYYATADEAENDPAMLEHLAAQNA